MIEIIISPPLRGDRWRATTEWGDRLAHSRTPLLSAARELQRRGVWDESLLAMRHEGQDFVAMTTTVGAAARLAVEEGDKVGPRFRPYKPFAGEGVAAPAAESGLEAVG